jgi:dihydrofolate reductase
MRKIIWYNLISLDGFFEGANHAIDWHHVDEEYNHFASDMLDSIGLLLFGRVTYELMAGYWPTETAVTNDPIIAEKMNRKPKVVYSTTLDKAEWNNTTLVKKNFVKETSKLKHGSGGDIGIFGSAILGNALLEAGLVDEIWVMVNPVVLRNGRPLFTDGTERLNLRRLNSQVFANGNVLVTYQPVMREKNFWQRLFRARRLSVKQANRIEV